MKKIIFFFTIIATFLNSCSNDNISAIDNDAETTYPVSFKIANPLAIEGVPFKAIKRTLFNSLEIRVYNESGDQLMNFYYNNTLKDIFKNDTVHIGLSLPKGIFHIGFYTKLDHTENIMNIGSAIDSEYNTHNFFSYYYPYEATYDYYESVTTTVTPTDQTKQQDITLKPMWSNLNITLSDALKFNVPEGTDAIQFMVSPLYTGFHLNTKLSTNKVSENWVSVYSDYKTNIISLDQIRANATFTYPTYVYQTLPENGNLAIKLNYLQTKGTTEPVVLKTRELKIPDITIENGYNYNIKGNLDATSNNQSMSISLGEFNKEAIEINF